MSFQKYAKYKESGVDWLGEVPKHWAIGHLRWFISIKSGEGLPNSQVSKKPLDGENYCVMGSNGTLGYSKFFNTLPKAFAIGRVGSCGEVHLLKEKCWVTDNALKVSKWEGFNDSYFEYMLRAANLKQYANQSVQPLITGEQVKALPVPRLPLEEQKQIAAFLDKETAKIDVFIDKQEQLTALLQEKRQAIISHAVTRGLNPNVKMKDSGIEWLGEVPEHWEVKKLKHIVTKPLMYGANEAAIDDDRDQPRFVRITDIRNNGTLREDTFRSLPWHLAKPYMLREGDVLLARSGATVGKSFIYSSDWGECCFAGYLIKASIDTSKASPYWFYRYTESDYYWNWISSILIQATIQNVSAEKYNNFSLFIPPKQEQNRIIAYLDKETAKIDTLIEKCEMAIELLKERRTALISAAVTGKIDVRNAV